MNRILITGGSGFIGTNLIAFLAKSKSNFLINIDINKPKIAEHVEFWQYCNILDKKNLELIFYKFKPNFVIHLAAKADINGKNLDDYKVNTDGTKNILDICCDTKTLRRIIITSTQFVFQGNGFPKNDEDFNPHTIYGKSKVISEILTRDAKLKCGWIIIRPTNIWGPWHWRYPYEFWKVISERKYLHPKMERVIRCYGYVGNVVWQIKRLMELDIEKVNNQVFYLGDKPIDILDWVNGFSQAQIGKKVRVINKYFIFFLALFGEFLNLFSIKFPIVYSRYRSMITSNTAPMDKTINILGDAPFTLDEGISMTVSWMKEYFPHLLKV